MEFKQYNANSKGQIESDCVRRALSLAYNIPYTQVKKELNGVRIRLGRSCYQYLDVVESFIIEHSYIDNGEGSGEIVQQFAKSHSYGVYLVICGDEDSQNHLTCIVDGTIYDTWDCSNLIVYSWYKIKEEESDMSFNVAEYRGVIRNLVKEIMQTALTGRNIFVQVERADSTTSSVKVTIDYKKHLEFELKVPYGTENPEEYLKKEINKKCKMALKKLV